MDQDNGIIPPNSTSNQHIIDRFERAISGQNGSFQQARDDIATLKLGFSVIERDVGKLAANVEKLIVRMEDSKKTNWPLIALLLGTAPFILGGMTFAMSSFTSSSLAPTTQVVATNVEAIRRLTDSVHNIESLAIASTQADGNSKTDRDQLNQRMTLAEVRVAGEEASRRAADAQFKSALTEVESQFHAVNNIENLRAAQQERFNAMVWEKSHPGSRYPNGTFFPPSMFEGHSLITPPKEYR